MTHCKIYPRRWYDGMLGVFFRVAASGLVPASWFRAQMPDERSRKASGVFPSLEIVSHCWKYAHLLAYQLSSLVLHPPTKLNAVVTIFHAAEDTDTTNLLEFIGRHDIPNIRWNWRVLPVDQLFRRAIGRNMAALATASDWIWMADCDIVFHQGCLDSLANQLVGRRDPLLFPRHERTTEMLAEACPMLQQGRLMRLVDIETSQFSLHARDRAKGAYQIIHGDVARAIGYCDGVSLYQTPSPRWCKCYEDRAFRWLVGTQGTPIDVAGVYQIRHLDKGRYQKGSAWARIRSKIRRMQE